MPLSLEAAACTLSMAGAGTLENACKGQQPCQPGVTCEAVKQTCAENSHAVFDMVVNAGGSLPPRDVQQNFCLRSECSGAFADALNSIDFSAGGTLSPKLLVSPLLSDQHACHPCCSSPLIYHKSHIPCSFTGACSGTLECATAMIPFLCDVQIVCTDACTACSAGDTLANYNVVEQKSPLSNHSALRRDYLLSPVDSK